MKELLAKNGIEYRDQEKYNTICPKCSPGRTKGDQECLQVKIKPNLVQWKCFHGDCGWEEEQVHYLNQLKKKTVFKKEVWKNDGNWNENDKYKFDQAIKYPYFDKDERLWFYILRWGHGKDKVIRPIQYTLGEYKFTRPEGPYMPYRIEKFDPAKRTLIVEGEKAADYTAKLVGDNYNVLSWVGGSKAIGRTDWSVLEDNEVVFWPDASEAGQAAFNIFKSNMCCSKLYLVDVSSLEYEQGIDDIPLEKAQQLLKEKEPIDLDVALTGELDPLNLSKMHNMEYKYYPSGFSNMDKIIQFPQSGLAVISGRTGHGKTLYMINVALNMAKNTDATVLYLSYEFPLEELNMRMVKALDKKDYGVSGWEADILVNNSLKNLDSKGAKEYAELLMSRKLRVVDAQTPIKEVISTMNRLKALKKPVIVFIDYLQVIPITDDGKNRYLQLKNLVEEIRFVANKNKQLLVGGSQLTAGEYAAADTVRESKDIEFTSALHLKIWNKDKARTPKEEKYCSEVPGDIVVIVEKARQGGRANGMKFGFTSLNGCDMIPSTIDSKKLISKVDNG